MCDCQFIFNLLCSSILITTVYGSMNGSASRLVHGRDQASAQKLTELIYWFRLDISHVSVPMGAAVEDKVGTVVTLEAVVAVVEVAVRVTHVARRVISPGSVPRVQV